MNSTKRRFVSISDHYSAWARSQEDRLRGTEESPPLYRDSASLSRQTGRHIGQHWASAHCSLPPPMGSGCIQTGPRCSPARCAAAKGTSGTAQALGTHDLTGTELVRWPACIAAGWLQSPASLEAQSIVCPAGLVWCIHWRTRKVVVRY